MIRPCLFPIVLALSLLTGLGAAAVRADDDDDDEVVVQPQPAFMIADENFDQWVFGQFQNAAGCRSHLDSLLLLQIEHAVEACGLSDGQKQKLQLAGRGDIKRLFESIDQLRLKFQQVKTDQNRIQELFREIQPFQVTLRDGPFGETSFFAKTLKNTLTSEQQARFEVSERERRLSFYRAAVELVVTELDETLVLRAAQRRQLVELLLEETEPPARFGQYDVYVVLVQAARLPEEKLKPLFDPPQWKTLARHFEKVRTLEPFLKANGILPGDGAAGGAAARPVMPALPAIRVRRAAPAGF